MLLQIAFMTKRRLGWHAGPCWHWRKRPCGACVRAEQAGYAELAADMKRRPAAGLCSARAVRAGCTASPHSSLLQPVAQRGTLKGILTGGVTTQVTYLRSPGAGSKAVGRASYRYLELLPLLLSLHGELGFLAHEDYDVYES